ncbi:MAG: MFS transporter, partial [Candidatus Solibacter sp.]
AERAMAMGMVNAGTAVGAVIAPPAIAYIIAALHWRWVFFLAGAVGLVWSVWWWKTYYVPDATPGEKAEGQAIPWLNLLGYRQVWGLLFAKFLSDAAWYFYLFWLPKYLYDARGFDTKRVGYYAWIPYRASAACAAAGFPAVC